MSSIARLLSVLAVIGLLVNTASTVAAQNATQAAEQAAQSHVMAAMDDMDCCPHAKPALPDCHKDCPLVVICMMSTAAHPAKADWVPAALHWSNLDFGPSSADVLASFEARPPSRPPKA